MKSRGIKEPGINGSMSELVEKISVKGTVGPYLIMSTSVPGKGD